MPTTQTKTTITDIAAEAAGLSSFMLRGQLVELLALLVVLETTTPVERVAFVYTMS